MFQLLDPFRALLDIGPVQMSVMAERRGQPLGREWHRLEGLVTGWLEDLKRYLPIARKPWPLLTNPGGWPRVLDRMYAAVKTAGDPDLTPMAAVAGTMAELVGDYLVKQGATKVLVNNGGDIAIRLGRGEKTRVGIAPRLGAPPTHYLDIRPGDHIGGVATSGRGGRSFTLGIADAAVAVASSAAVADACATVLGNAVNVDTPLIQRRPARELDPDTDIPELLVTTAVGPLPEELQTAALERGIETGRRLVEAGVLLGVVVYLNGFMRQYPEGLVHPIK
ncbi:hypothetical protein MGLY_06990 [Neomoorella glycerini]|uniref:FAD:protein FMN transferase n=1 Tax=Neomoorella glycerini TaxID=55779 RepID=A0A6I5ZP24_9FIRM|nr:UPF0280 family protein [Moorella glycerini]QGP91367.1 hypothetical protein MGLY_06990 [Moorella glycerini]